LHNPKYHLKIWPVLDDVQRPLWSVVIPTYNCANYLKATLASVLAQDPGPEVMEIIIVDDHSTKDDPEAVVQHYGQGRVKFIRQDKNVGKSRNYATGINKSKGEYIHLLHGDDTVSQGFYQKTQDLFLSYPKASAVFCRCNYVDAANNKVGETSLIQKNKGIVENFIECIAVWQVIQTPSIVFKRKVYEDLGAYDVRLKYIEDWEFYVRAAVKYEFCYLPEALAQYRVFPQNSSSKSAKGGQRIKTVHQVLSIIDKYLPQDIKNITKAKRKQVAALYLLSYIPQMIATKDIKGFCLYSKSFFHFNTNWRLYGRWLRFVFYHKKYYS
jgi:glycosyltransferase involved in cell wall biosynthesis